MKYNKRFLIQTLVVSIFTLSSCSSDDDSDLIGNWTERSTFNNEPRSNSAAFTIGDFGYMGTGFDGDDYLNDFWAYDINNNAWIQMADFPGTARTSAVGFAIGNQGYIGTGFDGDENEELKDFWKYDTQTNSWTQISDFGGTARRGAVAFGTEVYGYVGTGLDDNGDTKDFWKYNPDTDAWEEIFGFPGDKRRDATTFTLDQEVYLLSGTDNGIYNDDFWVFNTVSETWTGLDDFDEDDDTDLVRRASAVGFSLNGRGYIACGERLGPLSTVWEYNPVNNSWDEKTGFENLARQDAVVFNNGLRAIVSLGRNGSLYLDDSMEFFPNEAEDENDN